MPLTRPRRPDPNTLLYLQQLPADSVDAAIAALEDVANEIASLAGDETGAALLERLLVQSVPPRQHAALQALEHCLSYGMHLATHRYGSHVLQTILQRVSSVEDETTGSVTTSSTTTQQQQTQQTQLASILMQLVAELELVELVYHMCGSHVLRSIIACCGGVLEINSQQLRRGKEKKKKKKKTASEDTERRLNTITLTKGPVPPTPAMLQVLYKISDTLLEAFDPTDWPYHASSSALVGVLLQVLRLQQQQQQEEQANVHIQKWIAALDLSTHWNDFVNDTSASRLVEAAAESCNSSEEDFVSLFVQPLLKQHAMESMLQNENAAHVVSTVIRNLHKDNDTADAHDRIFQCLNSNNDDKHMQLIRTQRRSVLLALVQAASTTVQQQALVRDVVAPYLTDILRSSTYLVDTTGAQVIHHILTTYPSSIVLQPLILDHILPELLLMDDTTEYWCDSVASRWIVEPLVLHETYALVLEKKARKILPTIAQHRVGRHVVTKLNTQLPIQLQYAVADIQKKVRANNNNKKREATNDDDEYEE